MVTIQTEVYLLLDKLKHDYNNKTFNKDSTKEELKDNENKIKFIEDIQYYTMNKEI